MRIGSNNGSRIVMGILVGFLLAGCAATPTAVPTPTNIPTSTPVPTATPVPSATATASATPVPTATPTPQPITLVVVHTNDTEGYVDPCG